MSDPSTPTDTAEARKLARELEQWNPEFPDAPDSRAVAVIDALCASIDALRAENDQLKHTIQTYQREDASDAN